MTFTRLERVVVLFAGEVSVDVFAGGSIARQWFTKDYILPAMLTDEEIIKIAREENPTQEHNYVVVVGREPITEDPAVHKEEFDETTVFGIHYPNDPKRAEDWYITNRPTQRRWSNEECLYHLFKLEPELVKEKTIVWVHARKDGKHSTMSMKLLGLEDDYYYKLEGCAPYNYKTDDDSLLVIFGGGGVGLNGSYSYKTDDCRYFDCKQTINHGPRRVVYIPFTTERAVLTTAFSKLTVKIALSSDGSLKKIITDTFYVPSHYSNKDCLSVYLGKQVKEHGAAKVCREYSHIWIPDREELGEEAVFIGSFVNRQGKVKYEYRRYYDYANDPSKYDTAFMDYTIENRPKDVVDHAEILDTPRQEGDQNWYRTEEVDAVRFIVDGTINWNVYIPRKYSDDQSLSLFKGWLENRRVYLDSTYSRQTVLHKREPVPPAQYVSPVIKVEYGFINPTTPNEWRIHSLYLQAGLSDEDYLLQGDMVFSPRPGSILWLHSIDSVNCYEKRIELARKESKAFHRRGRTPVHYRYLHSDKEAAFFNKESPSVSANEMYQEFYGLSSLDIAKEQIRKSHAKFAITNELSLVTYKVAWSPDAVGSAYTVEEYKIVIESDFSEEEKVNFIIGYLAKGNFAAASVWIVKEEQLTSGKFYETQDDIVKALGLKPFYQYRQQHFEYIMRSDALSTLEKLEIVKEERGSGRTTKLFVDAAWQSQFYNVQFVCKSSVANKLIGMNKSLGTNVVIKPTDLDKVKVTSTSGDTKVVADHSISHIEWS